MITFKDYLAEVSIKIGTSDPAKEKAKEWIRKIYAKYHVNPINNRQHVMTWGKGDEQELGIFELWPSLSKPGAVDIQWFQAYPERKGVGSRAMKELQRQAKEDGIHLTLHPWEKGHISRANLVKFYKKLGFKPLSTRDKDMHWDPSWEDEKS